MNVRFLVLGALVLIFLKSGKAFTVLSADTRPVISEDKSFIF